MTDPDRRAAPATSGSLLAGAGILAFARYLVAALGWAGTAVIARRLSGPEFGAFTTVFGLLGLVGFVSELRMSRLVISAMTGADDEDAGRVIGCYTALRIVIGLVGWAVAMAVVTIGGFDPEVVRATALAGSVLVLMSAWYALILLFQARMWLRTVAVSQVAGQAAQLVSILAVAAAGIGSAVWFSLPAVISAVVGLVWIAASLRRSVRVRLHVDLPTWWSWLKEAAPLSLGFALETAYFRIDVLMLSVMSATLTPVGMYGVGYRFSDLVGSLPIALLAPALALMVDAWTHDRQRFHQTFQTSLVILFLAGVGVGIGFAVFADEAITLLYGERYSPAAGAARLLVLGQVLHFFTSLSFTTLVAVGRNRLYPAAALVGVVINVGLNLVLIPSHSYRGSAIATIITEVSVLAILFVGVARVPDVRPLPWRGLARISLAGLILAAALIGLRPLLPWPALAVAGAAGYLLLLHVFAIAGPGGLRALARDARLEMQGRPVNPDSDSRTAEKPPPPAVSGGSDDYGHGPEHPPLRLTAISPHSIVSGAEVVLLRALHAAAESGWVVRCACPEGPLAERLRAEGIPRDDMPDLRLPSGPRLLGAVTVFLRTGARRSGSDAWREAPTCCSSTVSMRSWRSGLRASRHRSPG
ncbi:MAG: flippase [Acidimicrobiia bacterium]|nr:flippase [Acidimicrobiia bacterium]